MRHVFLVTVLQSEERLTKIMASQRFLQTAGNLNYVEELSVGGVLENTVVYLHRSIAIAVQAAAGLEHSKNMRVFQILQDVEFSKCELPDTFLKIVI